MDRNDILRSIENHKNGLAPLLSAYQELVNSTKGKGEAGKDRAFTAEEFEKHAKLGTDINVLNQAIGTDRAALRAITLSDQADDLTAAELGLGDRSKLPQASDEYMAAFMAFSASGFSGRDCDPEKFKMLTTVAPSTGGVLIPTEIEKTILMEALSQSPLLGISNVSMTSTLKLQIPFGGRIGVMGPRKEAEAYVLSDPTLTTKSIDIFNYGGFMPISQELLEDTDSLPAYIAEVFAEAYAETVEEYGWKGTGGQTAFTNQAGGAVAITLAGRVCPGIRTMAAGDVPVVVAAGAAAITSDDLIKLKQAVKPKFRPNGVYVFSSDLETKALLLKDTTGRPLWMPNLIVGQPATINGSAYSVSDRLDVVATGNNTAFFGDFKRGHEIKIRKGLTIKTSGHYLFGNGMIAVAADVRFGAMVKLKEAIARLNQA